MWEEDEGPDEEGKLTPQLGDVAEPWIARRYRTDLDYLVDAVHLVSQKGRLYQAVPGGAGRCQVSGRKSRVGR